MTVKANVLRSLPELYRHHHLLQAWIVRDLTVRYKQSVLGIAWAVLQPLSIMLICTAVFSFLVKVPTGGIPYPLFCYCAILLWGLLTTAIATGVPSLVGNMQLVTKVYFPREVIPISAVAAAVIDFLVGFVVFIGLMIFYGVGTGPAVIMTPVFLLIEIVLVLGLTMWAAALNVFYRDIRFVVPLITQLWMYVTPVIYPASLVPEQYRTLYMLNPMAGIVEGFRNALLLGQWPEPSEFILSSVTSFVILALGYAYFKRAEVRFADLI